MPTYNPDIHSGGEGTTVSNGVDWNVTKWSGKVQKTTVDVTTTGDFDSVTGITYGRKKVTMEVFTFTIEAFRDGNNDIAPGLVSPVDLVNTVLTSFAGHTVSMPKALVESFDLDSGGTAGVNKVTISGQSQGKFTIT